MNKSFSQIKTNVGAEVGDTSSSFGTLIGRFVNRRYTQVLRTVNFNNINTAHTISVTAGTSRYALPEDFKAEVACTDTTNDRELSAMTLSELYQIYPDPSGSGTVERYCIFDDVVRAHPSSASLLSIVSSSAADTTQTVFVRGVLNGVELTESVTLTGTSAASTTNQYTAIKGISKSATTTGSVTVTSNSGGVTNAVLSPEVLTSYSKVVLFHYVPAAALTVSMPYIVNPLPMVNDYDYPIIDIADILELGAMADAQRYKKQFAKGREYESLFSARLGEYVFDKENTPNLIHMTSPAPYTRDTV